MLTAFSRNRRNTKVQRRAQLSATLLLLFLFSNCVLVTQPGQINEEVHLTQCGKILFIYFINKTSNKSVMLWESYAL